MSATAAPARAAVGGPVSLVVPYTPSTGPDVLARPLAPFLGQRLGQPVVVDNRAGALGTIGSQFATRAAPDGRTLMLQANTFVMKPGLFWQVPYDAVNSFAPVAQLTRGDLALVVNPDVSPGDTKQLADLARAKPGRLGYASPGIGTPQHLGMALFAKVAKIELSHVPYRGSAPAIQDLLSKRVAAMFLPVHTALPLAQSGQTARCPWAARAAPPSRLPFPRLRRRASPARRRTYSTGCSAPQAYRRPW